MKLKSSMALAVTLAVVIPISADAKKKPPNRAVLEKMEAVPCGAKQRGLSGLGSFWASVGITDIHSTEKLCPQYVVRTDDMDYRVQPENLKHPDVLPIGREVVFKIEKDHMLMSVADSGKKMKKYEVVAMDQAKPVSASARSESQ